MDSYILRIYQRAEEGTQRLVGVLETTDGNTRYLFRNVEELWWILLTENGEAVPAVDPEADSP